MNKFIFKTLFLFVSKVLSFQLLNLSGSALIYIAVQDLGLVRFFIVFEKSLLFTKVAFL